MIILFSAAEDSERSDHEKEKLRRQIDNLYNEDDAWWREAQSCHGVFYQ